MITDMSSLGDFTRERRILAGYRTQSDFATRLGKDQAWVSRLERISETLPPDEMALVAEALGASQSELLAAAGYDIETGREGEPPALSAVRAILEGRDFTEKQTRMLATLVRDIVEMMED